MDLNDTPDLAEYRARVRAWLDEHAGVPGMFDVIGVGMLGPTIIAHGSEDQRHLGPMLTGEEVADELFAAV